MTRPAAALLPAAIVLAGSRPGGDPFATAQGAAHKALIEVGGEPMLARVIAALAAAGVPRIAVAADHPEVIALARSLGVEIVPPAAGPSGSVAAAFAVLGAPMLVATADSALLRPEWVRDFVDDTPAGADVAILLARRDAVERDAPASKRTWLRFADGDWSGCNLFLLGSPRAQAAIATWQAVEADRKRPWRIAARLGLGTLLSYALGRLTLRDAVARLGRRVGIAAAAVPARNGLAALDVDKATDLEQVRRIVAG